MPYVYGGNKALLNVTGNSDLVSEGVKALEALPDLLAKLDSGGGDEASIAEIFIFENMPIRALIFDGFGFVKYLWAPAGWVQE